MNRRTLLKFLATICGAAVVCPGELVKITQPGLRLWPLQKIFIEKIRQQGCTDSTFNWVHYYLTCNYIANPL